MADSAALSSSFPRSLASRRPLSSPLHPRSRLLRRCRSGSRWLHRLRARAGKDDPEDLYGPYPWDQPLDLTTGLDIQWVPEDRVTLFTSDGLVQIGGSLVPRRVTSSEKRQRKLKSTQKLRRFQESSYMDPNQSLCLGALFNIAATNGLDMGRRLCIFGFCRSIEMLSDVAALRQLVGQVQELWDLYGANAHPLPRWYLLDFEHGSIKDDYCGGRTGYNSELLKIMETNQSPPRKRPRRDRNREKAPCSNATEVMQQEIWKEFPEDLFETVIARLPIAAIFRFRTVCRNWSSLLGSDSFSRQYSEAPHGLPWFYTITHENANNNVAMYDPSLKKWHHPSVPLAPTKIVIPVASVGGLVCLLDLSHRNFYICNPLTQSLKEIPPRSVQGWSRVAVGMVSNGRSSSDGYKVMWLGNDGTYEVYESTKNTWSCPGVFPPSIKLPLALNFRSQPVAVGSTLYFMCAEPDGVLSYDVSNGIWRQFAIPLPLHLTDHTLAEFQGKVMLVGLLCKNAATCVCIWELQKMTLLWKEVDRMPNIWCLEFYGKHTKMTCLGNSGLLMLSLKAKRMNRLVTYNLLKREWQKVPDCMLPCSRKKQWIACGTAFDPCPSALA